MTISAKQITKKYQDKLQADTSALGTRLYNDMISNASQLWDVLLASDDDLTIFSSTDATGVRVVCSFDFFDDAVEWHTGNDAEDIVTSFTST